MIIGITGTLGAGKGTLVDFLVKDYGFKHFSFRDFIVEEVKRRGLPVVRDSMTSVANDLRQKFGPTYIVESLYKKALESGGNVILESVRAIKEAEFIKENGGLIFAIDADIKTRYERIVKRGSVTDNVSFEKFIEDEGKEIAEKDPHKQNIRGVINIADHVFTNEGSVEELRVELNQVLKEKI